MADSAVVDRMHWQGGGQRKLQAPKLKTKKPWNHSESSGILNFWSFCCFVILYPSVSSKLEGISFLSGGGSKFPTSRLLEK